MARDLDLNVILKAVDRATRPLKEISKTSKGTAEALKASRTQLRDLQNAQKNLRGFRELRESSQATSQSLREQQNRVAALTREIRDADGPVKRLNQSRDKAIRQARRLKEQYGREQQQLEALRREIRRDDGATGTLAEHQHELQRRVDAATKSIERQESALANQARRQQAASEASRRYARSQARASRMVTSGAGGMIGGGAALYGLGRLIDPGIKFEEQISELSAVANLKKTSPQLAMLKKQARDLGRTTPFTATEVGGAQTFLARAGFTPKAIRSSVQAVLNEALVGNIDLPRAADISSNIAGVFGIDTEKAGAMTRVVDQLTAASTHANVDIEMLGETMKYLGQATSLHVTLAQAAALAGALGNVGIQGTQAGTTLREMMVKLTNPTAKAAKAIKELHLQLADKHGNLRSIPDILQQIDKATQHMGNVKRNKLLGDIFEARAGSGVAVLLQNLPKVANLLNVVENAHGSTQSAANKEMDNAGGDLRKLQSAFESLRISIFETNKGPLRNYIQNITAITSRASVWINQNPQAAATIVKIATAVATLVTVGGALVFTLGSILGPLALTRYGFSLLFGEGRLLRTLIVSVARVGIPLLITAIRGLTLAMLTNPIGLMITAIVALGIAGYELYRHWDAVSSWFVGIWHRIQAAFQGGIDGIMRLILNWSPAGLLYRAVVSGLEALGVKIPPQFRTLGSAIIEGIIGGIESMAGALEKKIVGIAGSVSGWFKSTLGIHSPSRVFISHGRDTMAGYQIGLQSNENGPLGQVNSFAKRLRAAGAGIAIGAAALPGVGAAAPVVAQQPAIQFDQRPPANAAARSSGDVKVIFSGDVNIHNGRDETDFMAAVEAAVARAIDARKNQDGARNRSALYDTD